ncbi:MAG: hypothetical protein QOE45_1999 [Frankiaceae bacterium]|nr:hypothetical protein [Frankiaceae bacterium]
MTPNYPRRIFIALGAYIVFAAASIFGPPRLAFWLATAALVGYSLWTVQTIRRNLRQHTRPGRAGPTQ